jgi:hypothetical protein
MKEVISFRVHAPQGDFGVVSGDFVKPAAVYFLHRGSFLRVSQKEVSVTAEGVRMNVDGGILTAQADFSLAEAKTGIGAISAVGLRVPAVCSPVAGTVTVNGTHVALERAVGGVLRFRAEEYPPRYIVLQGLCEKGGLTLGAYKLSLLTRAPLAEVCIEEPGRFSARFEGKIVALHDSGNDLGLMIQGAAYSAEIKADISGERQMGGTRVCMGVPYRVRVFSAGGALLFRQDGRAQTAIRGSFKAEVAFAGSLTPGSVTPHADNH